MAIQSYHVFEPRPGELARDAILRRSHGALPQRGGGAPYRVVDVSGGIELTGSRDECIDFVEVAWWHAETAPTNTDQVHAANRAARLRFDRRRADGHGWERDGYLNSAIASLHSF